MKSKPIYLCAMVLGLLLFTLRPAAAIIEPIAFIEADCDGFTLRAQGIAPYESSSLQYTLMLTSNVCPSGNLTGGIAVKGSVEITVQECVDIFCFDQVISGNWEDICVYDSKNVKDILVDGNYTLTGQVTVVCNGIPFYTIDIDPVEISDCEPDLPAASCEDGKPAVLRLRYLGGLCPTDPGEGNDQDAGKVKCDGPGASAGSVYVIATDKDKPGDRKAKIWFEGAVGVGETFDIDAATAGRGKLSSATRVFVYDTAGGNLIQKITFHTSCSQPLNIGDVFGTLKVEGYIPSP